MKFVISRKNLRIEIFREITQHYYFYNIYENNFIFNFENIYKNPVIFRNQFSVFGGHFIFLNILMAKKIIQILAILP